MMDYLKYLVAFGGILFFSGFILTIVTWPYALAVVEVDRAYPITSGIIFIGIFTGQLMSVVATSLFARCVTEFGKELLWFLIVTFYIVIWFSCGAGQLVVVVLMVINVEMNNDDVGGKVYGGLIIALTVVHMFASSVYSTVVFIWFYHKWKQQRQ